MQFNGGFGNAHLIGNLFVGHSLGDIALFVALPGCQRFAFGFSFIGVAEQAGVGMFNNRRGKISAAVQNQLQGRSENFSFGTFGNIAADSLFESLFNVAVIF